jgi:Glycosyltransferase Family 4
VKILITNYRLDGYSGTEVVVRDLALELQRQGHEPVVYSPRPGPVAGEIRNNGIEVVSDLNRLNSTPDIIHGQHHAVAVEALRRFPSIPAIYVCHDAASYLDKPFYLPRILRYIAVDHRVRQRIESVVEIPRSRIRVILNSVDLEKFQPRAPLPPRPRKALVFSNYAARYRYLPVVQRACRQAGLDLDVLGKAAGTQVADPERLLPHYDIVFAKARCALEAMAVGNAVILCDFLGTGPLVTSENFDRLRVMNFGRSALLNPLRPEYLTTEIHRYDASDAAQVSRRTRTDAGLKTAVHQWITLYEEVVAEWRSERHDPAVEDHAIRRYEREWRKDPREQLVEFLRRIPLARGVYHALLEWKTSLALAIVPPWRRALRRR